MAAKYAAKAGSKVILLEEHSCVGWPVECAGLLGEKAMQESERCRGTAALQGMRGATVFSPGGFQLRLKAADCRAWVVDRRLFDRSMALDALQSGAELRLRSSVRKAVWNGDHRTLTLAGGELIQAKIVISAEGVRARLARSAGISPPRRFFLSRVVQAVMPLIG